MPKRLFLVHTVTGLVPVFEQLCDQLIPAWEVYNIIDESLLKNTISEGQMSKLTARRLFAHLVSAEQAGADAAMVTCSSVGEVVDQARPFLDIPLFRVDQPMADQAVKLGHRIGVAATLRTTLNPTVSLIETRAASIDKDIEVVSQLCEGAFEAVIGGDTAKHDKLVKNGLDELIKQSDVIVLAQASMARVVEQSPEITKSIPILSSPQLAVEHLAKIL